MQNKAICLTKPGLREAACSERIIDLIHTILWSYYDCFEISKPYITFQGFPAIEIYH